MNKYYVQCTFQISNGNQIYELILKKVKVGVTQVGDSAREEGNSTCSVKVLHTIIKPLQFL